MDNITNFRTGIEACGNGQVIVARWEYKGKQRHVSTLKNARTVYDFNADIWQKLQVLAPYDLARYGA